MEIKKNPKQQLEKFSKIFFELGLVLTLFIIYTLIEHKTYEKIEVETFGEVHMTAELEDDVEVEETL